MDGGSTKNIQIVRVPDPKDGVAAAPPLPPPGVGFERMPRMYLELIENKDKIRQNLVNQEYDPDDQMSDVSYFKKKTYAAPKRQEVVPEEEDEDISDATSSHASDASPASDGSSSENVQEMVSNDGGNSESIITDEEDVLSDEGGLSSAGSSLVAPRVVEQVHQTQPSIPQQYEKFLKPPPAPKGPIPPRLADLQKTGEYVDTNRVIPDLARVYNKSDEEEEELKREILFKFDILRKAYKQFEIPDHFTLHTDIKTLTRAYEHTLRRISLDSNVETYKQYLIGGFMLTEFLVSHWFSFDMQGFTQQQILNMASYERLLIEIGEKSYVPGGRQWPVEVRLLFMIIMNAAFFIISKIILKKTGSNLMGMMNDLSSRTARAAAPAQQNSERRRMRGPSIDPDDIPDIGANTVA